MKVLLTESRKQLDPIRSHRLPALCPHFVTFGPGAYAKTHARLLRNIGAEVYVSYFAQVQIPFEHASSRLDHLLAELSGWAHEAYRDGERLRAKVGIGGPRPILAKTVMMEAGQPERGPDLIAIPIAWRATGTPALFPQMNADLQIGRATEDSTQIRLSGSYTVPLGTIGQIFDDAVLHRVAEKTIQNFVNRVAEAMIAE